MSKEQDIVEGNISIVTFLGKEQTGKYGYWLGEGRYARYFKPSELKYHSSWDWLMPVVEKIEKLKVVEEFVIKQNGSYLIVNGYGILKKPSYEKIWSVWLIVIQFIQWYQQNQKPQ